MSLNRSEQMVYDYVQAHPEERHFWTEKVRRVAAQSPDDHAAATQLADQLWAYYEERAGVVSPFREVVKREGLRRMSMRNLAEYLLRLWTVPRPKKKPAADALEPPYGE
ncbi:MAG TPA: hypothetical protein VGD81_10200 [Opitutaceae bacterium]